MPPLRLPPRPTGQLPNVPGYSFPSLPGTAPAVPSRQGPAPDPMAAGAAQAQVRYGPEEQALQMLMVQAYQDLLSQVNINRSTAAGIQATADVVKPALQRTYGQAVGDVNAGAEQLDSDLGDLGDAGQGFQAASDREANAARTRLSEGMAGALSELDQRRMDAAAGEQFGNTRAFSQYGDARNQIGARLEAIAGERGAYTTAAAGDINAANQTAQEKADALLQAAGIADRRDATSRRGQDITAAHNAATEAQAAAEGPGGSAEKPSAGAAKFAKDLQSVADRISYARSLGPAGGWTPARIRKNLAKQGVPGYAISAAFQIVNGRGAISPTMHRYLTSNQGLTGLPRTGWQVPYPPYRRTPGPRVGGIPVPGR